MCGKAPAKLSPSSSEPTRNKNKSREEKKSEESNFIQEEEKEEKKFLGFRAQKNKEKKR